MGYFSFKEEQDSIRNIVITDPNVLGSNFGSRLQNGEFDSITINYQIKMEYNPLNPDVCLGSNSPFSGLNTLKRITCPIILGEQVESTAGMFYGCSSLQEVPLFDTSRVKDMNRMFLGCTQLKEIPAFDTSSSNNMSGMFCGCGSLFSSSILFSPWLKLLPTQVTTIASEDHFHNGLCVIGGSGIKESNITVLRKV